MTKFQELQAKAFELCKKHEDEGKSVVMTDEWLRIYSELIVKECVLETMDAIHYDTSIRTHLYNHFGVEK
jgi:hypothetical protein